MIDIRYFISWGMAPIHLHGWLSMNQNPEGSGYYIHLTHPHNPAVNRPRKTMIPSVLDTSTIHGPNGNNACYITVPPRASLFGVKDGSWVRLF